MVVEADTLRLLSIRNSQIRKRKLQHVTLTEAMTHRGVMVGWAVEDLGRLPTSQPREGALMGVGSQCRLFSLF